jgi:hypothetical protein
MGILFEDHPSDAAAQGVQSPTPARRSNAQGALTDKSSPLLPAPNWNNLPNYAPLGDYPAPPPATDGLQSGLTPSLDTQPPPVIFPWDGAPEQPSGNLEIEPCDEACQESLNGALWPPPSTYDFPTTEHIDPSGNVVDDAPENEDPSLPDDPLAPAFPDSDVPDAG